MSRITWETCDHGVAFWETCRICVPYQLRWEEVRPVVEAHMQAWHRIRRLIATLDESTTRADLETAFRYIDRASYFLGSAMARPIFEDAPKLAESA